MKLLLATGLTAALLTGSAGAVALVAGPPDDVELPEQAQVPEVDLPEQAQVPEVEVPYAPEAPEADAEDEGEAVEDGGEPASDAGAARKAAAMDFVTLMQEWTTCVEDAAEAHEGETEPFYPTEACGDRPAPPVPDRAADKVPPRAPASTTPGAPDLSDLPAQAEAGRDRAEEATDEGATHREEGVANAPADRPGGRP